MKERPILFSAPMVRAILDGTKTVTRRIVRVRDVTLDRRSSEPFKGSHFGTDSPQEMCPYGVAGDRLWVRESIWCANDTDGEMDYTYDCGSMLSLGAEYAQVQYVATPECCDPPELEGEETVQIRDGHEHAHGSWWHAPPADWKGDDWWPRGKGEWQFCPTTYCTKHPSIHMPRWASRILLEVVDVRVERLLNITDEDAKREGVRPFFEVYTHIGRDQRITDGTFARDEEYRASFACLWDELNGDRALWNTNPWVWRVEFKRVETQATEQAA